jgi:hypothetical protein
MNDEFDIREAEDVTILRLVRERDEARAAIRMMLTEIREWDLKPGQFANLVALSARTTDKTAQPPQDPAPAARAISGPAPELAAAMAESRIRAEVITEILAVVEGRKPVSKRDIRLWRERAWIGARPVNSTQGAAYWRHLADERLGQLAEIARIGAEPPDAVLAIIQGKTLDPAAGTADTSTAYHHSVAEFRQELVKSAEFYHEIMKPHDEEITAIRRRTGGSSEDIPTAVWDAHAGLLMAGSYAYTLAAVLGVAEREFGPQTARGLASVAGDILANGDFDDLNADVAAATDPGRTGGSGAARPRRG